MFHGLGVSLLGVIGETEHQGMPEKVMSSMRLRWLNKIEHEESEI